MIEAIVYVHAVHIKRFRPQGISNEPSSPWVDLGEEVELTSFVPGYFDLMILKDDLFTQLGVTDLPEGHYSMIRLTLEGKDIVLGVDEGTRYPFYVAQDNKIKLDEKKGIKIFETFYVCPHKHTYVTLKFPEDGLLTWIKDWSTVRLHPKIWVKSVENE